MLIEAAAAAPFAALEHYGSAWVGRTVVLVQTGANIALDELRAVVGVEGQQLHRRALGRRRGAGMTSIAQCRVHLLVEPLAETRGPSCAWYSSRESLLVRLTDNDGRSGWGETSLRPGVVEAARELGASLVGADPLAATRSSTCCSGSRLIPGP